MKLSIVIDTDDADDPDAIAGDTPFTLNVYQDHEDGSVEDESLLIGSEFALIGNDIAEMLDELRIAFARDSVLDEDERSVPRTGEQWRERVAEQREIESGRCDECDQPATQFWPELKRPVQLCDGCAHDARRSGWSPGQ